MNPYTVSLNGQNTAAAKLRVPWNDQIDLSGRNIWQELMLVPFQNITSMKLDAQTGKFELRYELDLTIKMPSEILYQQNITITGEKFS